MKHAASLVAFGGLTRYRTSVCRRHISLTEAAVHGRVHNGENGARCTMAKIGGGGFCDDNDAFARVYNNLLLHKYIYYFTPVHF